MIAFLMFLKIMDYYIPLIIYLVLVSLIFRKSKWASILLTIVPLILFWGTKVDFGPDYDNYLFKYDRQHDMSIYGFLLDAMEGKFEPGFFFLLKLMPSFNAVVFVTSAFLIISVYYFLNEFVPKHLFPLALFLWLFNFSIFNTFSAMRSSFVIGFFLLAIVAKMRYYNKTAIILALVGAQFHMSGYLLFLLILLPFNYFMNKQKILIPLVFVFAFIALLLPSVFSESLKVLIGSNQNLSVYEDHVQETDYGLGFYFFSFIRVGFILYIFDLIRRKLIVEKYLWIAWLTVLFYLLTLMQGIPIIYRVFNYFFLITVAFKCYVLIVDKTVASKIYVGLSALYALYNFYKYQSSDLMQFYKNYHSFLFQ